jgi:very-short-patch-repair endonuclease
LNNRTKAEKLFSSILSQSNARVIEQPYFKINDKGYFLDFYLPDYYLAFELNGKIHKGEDGELYDMHRDYAFHSIGIKTVRLSNRDIEADNIKTRINEWANMAMSGEFDPSLYYQRADCTKFDGKQTLFQELHSKINEILSKDEFCGKSVLIVSDYTYFSDVLWRERYDTKDRVNREYVDEFYDIVEKNNIRIDSYYSGSMDNMKNRQKEYYIERNNESTKKRIDYVLKTDGHDIVVEEYKYPDVHQIQIMVLKDKDGKSYLSYICPYKMFFPYRKADARKKEIRTRQILAGGNLCHFCKFMKGKDIKNGLLFCEGFKNKGSKNLYDNLKLNFYELNEEYQKYLEYKKTDEYRQIETVLMKNGG